ncbi:MAG TPA: lipid A deacylase LpxR family protein [Clostridia bacterium]|nr:lipid A deacylase LpxR family protein [Clostridia bacterium]
MARGLTGADNRRFNLSPARGIQSLAPRQRLVALGARPATLLRTPGWQQPALTTNVSNTLKRLVRDCLALLVAGSSASAASDLEQAAPLGPVFAVLEENDLIVDTDRHYTQGIKFSFLFADDDVPGCVQRFSDALPQLGFSKNTDRVGFVVGQSIYTPADLKQTALIPDDRPYAGWLYGGLVLHRRGRMLGSVPVLESLQLDLGIIGPESLSQEAQTWVHELRDFEIFQGWRNQLKTEPGMALRYQRSGRLSLGKTRRYLDLMPHAGFSLGNVETSFRGGGQLRVGLNLPEDFGVQHINSLLIPEGGWSTNRAGGGWGAYLFAGAEACVVGYTAFLDGNLFRDSHSVDKEPFVAEFKGGIMLLLGRVEAGAAYVYRSREFAGQDRENRYGSLFVKMTF